METWRGRIQNTMTAPPTFNDRILFPSTTPKTEFIPATSLALHVYTSASNMGIRTVGEGRCQELRTIVLNLVSAYHGYLLPTDCHEVLFLFQGEWHNHRAIEAALTLEGYFTQENQHHFLQNQDQVRLSIGIHSGEIRTETAVNEELTRHPMVAVARQLCEMNRQTPFPAVFVSSESYNQVHANANWHLESLGVFVSQDHAKRFALFAVMNKPRFLPA